MANQIGFRINIGNLPEGWEGTPQELLDKVAELLSIAFDDEIAIFKTGTTQPDSLTNQAWLRDGKEWFVPDEDGNWVPVDVDDRLKFIYVRSTNPFVGAESDNPKERALWLRTNTAGTEARELSVYLAGEWRSLFLLSAFVDLQNLAADNQSRIDTVIETTEDGGGLKEDVVGFPQLTVSGREEIQRDTLSIDGFSSIDHQDLGDENLIYIFRPNQSGSERFRSITGGELRALIDSTVAQQKFQVALSATSFTSAGGIIEEIDGDEVYLLNELNGNADGVTLNSSTGTVTIPAGNWYVTGYGMGMVSGGTREDWSTLIRRTAVTGNPVLLRGSYVTMGNNQSGINNTYQAPSSIQGFLNVSSDAQLRFIYVRTNQARIPEIRLPGLADNSYLASLTFERV